MVNPEVTSDSAIVDCGATPVDSGPNCSGRTVRNIASSYPMSCLILQYIGYMKKHSVEAARLLFDRACTIHLQKKPNIHMEWAAFEEMQGAGGI